MRPDLPISSYEEEILRAVKYNRVVIIKAETGAGKSTQVPQFLLKLRGHEKVIVTQPRRLAVTSIAARVAEEMQCKVGELVGYRISRDRKESDQTRLVFCTDGLEMVTELLNSKGPDGILVIDEVHEWNLNIEVLVAWIRAQLQKGVEYKVVLMSATIDATALAEYFGEEAVTIDVPGRTYPVTDRQRGQSIVDDAMTLLKEGSNVLIFQPGKVQINRIVSTLLSMDLDAEIFPLHGDMELIDQLPCFLSYPRPKCIVATNVAQTSITIPDIDAVIDSGLERRADYVDEVEGLYLRSISIADRQQRKGRAGRTRPGIYIDFCPTKLPERSLFAKPEVLSLPLEKTVLQLDKAGMPIEGLKFFHQPDIERIAEARLTLRAMGCIDENNALTPIGTTVASLPISARFGRMLVEAEKRGVLSEMITLVSIMEEGGVTKDKRAVSGKVSALSDAFVQMAAFTMASRLPVDQLASSGIDVVAFLEARDTQQRLLEISKQDIQRRVIDREREIVRCLYTGLVDRVYKRSVIGRGYKDSKGNLRNLPDWSVVGSSERVVGLPWNLQVGSEFGQKTHRLITMATRVDDKLFAQVAT